MRYGFWSLVSRLRTPFLEAEPAPNYRRPAKERNKAKVRRKMAHESRRRNRRAA